VKRDGRWSAGIPIAALAVIGALTPSASSRPPDAVPRRHVVEIQGMQFHPAVLEVQRGDTVVWVNRDIVPHTATSTRKSGWDTGALARGDSGRYVVRHRGEDRYSCRLHPVMLGELIVQ
jgi:plastocyanin